MGFNLSWSLSRSFLLLPQTSALSLSHSAPWRQCNIVDIPQWTGTFNWNCSLWLLLPSQPPHANIGVHTRDFEGVSICKLGIIIAFERMWSTGSRQNYCVGTTRLVPFCLALLAVPNREWLLPRWWLTSDTSSWKIQGYLLGRSGTDCLLTASATNLMYLR